MDRALNIVSKVEWRNVSKHAIELAGGKGPARDANPINVHWERLGSTH